MITGTISPEEIARYARLDAEIARLRSALEAAEKGLGHYADKELWNQTETGRPYKDWYQPFRHGYDIARETLAEVQRLKEGK